MSDLPSPALLLDKPCGTVRSEIFRGPPGTGAVFGAVGLAGPRNGGPAKPEIRPERVAKRPAAEPVGHCEVEFTRFRFGAANEAGLALGCAAYGAGGRWAIGRCWRRHRHGERDQFGRKGV